ncbi:MAG: Calx-beta domain protein, partial [Anaerolineales bacterium]|nr:Calx-beta domain protein [Anaerolineales bacterium]
MNTSPVRARIHFIRSLSAVTLAIFIALALAATLIVILDRWQPTVAQANGEIVQFEFTAYSVDEADGIATITVTLNSDPGVAVTVDYATSDGTAGGGSDYTPITGTLTFTTGL